MFHSQCGEDKWIWDHIAPGLGTFCEVGAYDGVLSSNTCWFEKQGWRGLLLEPDPEMFTRCRTQRKAPCLCLCAGKEMGVTNFHVNEADKGLSGITRPGIPMPHISVRLDWILTMFHLTDLTLLSIDTEGTELDVWEGLGSIRPRIVIIEHQTCDLPSQEKPIFDRLCADGYFQVHRTQYNLIFQRT